MDSERIIIYLAISNYKRIHKRWKIRAYFQKKLGREVEEEPLLYSNIPLSVPYVPLSREILRREVRPRYKSVCYVNEASLVADSQMFRDMELNERLMLFNKLFGHETLGGMCIYDTQCIVDLYKVLCINLHDRFYTFKTIIQIACISSVESVVGSCDYTKSKKGCTHSLRLFVQPLNYIVICDELLLSLHRRPRYYRNHCP